MTSTLLTYKNGLDTLLASHDMEYHFTPAKKLQWANWAGERVLGHFDWPWANKAVQFSAEENQEWYDLDDSKIRLDGIFRVTSGPKATEKQHEYMQFERYQTEKADPANYVSAVFGRQVFYSPQATTGDPVSLYGKRQWIALTADGDKSVIPSSYDEAVIQYMLMYAHQDSMNPEEADKAEARAKNMLDRKAVVQSNDQPAGYAGVVPNSRFTT